MHHVVLAYLPFLPLTIILTPPPKKKPICFRAVPLQERINFLIGFYFIKRFVNHIPAGADQEKVQLASHVLQFVFLGHTGFRFPFAHWPRGGSGNSLHSFVEISLLAPSRRILSAYCCCDGGSANRSFIKLHFSGKDPYAEKFTTTNPYTREPLVFLMDPYVSLSSNMKCTFQGKTKQVYYNFFT